MYTQVSIFEIIRFCKKKIKKKAYNEIIQNCIYSQKFNEILISIRSNRFLQKIIYRMEFKKYDILCAILLKSINSEIYFVMIHFSYLDQIAIISYKSKINQDIH